MFMGQDGRRRLGGEVRKLVGLNVSDYLIDSSGEGYCLFLYILFIFITFC